MAKGGTGTTTHIPSNLISCLISGSRGTMLQLGRSRISFSLRESHTASARVHIYTHHTYTSAYTHDAFTYIYIHTCVSLTVSYAYTVHFALSISRTLYLYAVPSLFSLSLSLFLSVLLSLSVSCSNKRSLQSLLTRSVNRLISFVL